MLQLVQIMSEYAVFVASHDYILGVHMNERTLLNNVMVPFSINVRRSPIPNRAHSHSPHDFWSPYEYLIHCQSEDFCRH